VAIRTLEGLDLRSRRSFRPRTLAELESELEQSDYAILSEDHDSVYPGSILSPQLLEIAKKRADFELISVFTHSNGSHTYLFRHNR
jgi:hypothetical protein